jgi:4-nitrophenyl phosphatase
MILLDDKSCWKQIRDTKLFLLDLDGTVYLENELIPGVKKFTEYLSRLQVPYVFLTNNSSCSGDEYLKKLLSMGISASSENILTSGQATGEYLTTVSGAVNLFVVGTDALKRELEGHGHLISENEHAPVDYVVVGFDTELTYDKLRAACIHLENGAGFVATNPDLVCPIKGKKYLPDCGSIYKMLENATGRQPVIVGKPTTTMVDIIKKRYLISSEEMAIIGDRLYTDIALGNNAAIFSLCVLTGESTLENIHLSPWIPDQVISSIDFLNGAFSNS